MHSFAECNISGCAPNCRPEALVPRHSWESRTCSAFQTEYSAVPVFMITSRISPFIRDGYVKIPCFKETEYGAEPKAHIELVLLLAGIVTAETLREDAGTVPSQMNAAFRHLDGMDSCAFAGRKPPSFQPYRPKRKTSNKASTVIVSAVAILARTDLHFFAFI